jgi:hypothetical protein
MYEYIDLRVQGPSLVSDSNETLIFTIDFRKNIQILNFMKIRLVGAELFHMDKQADMTRLTVAFPRFANEPKNAGCESQRTNYEYSAADYN